MFGAIGCIFSIIVTQTVIDFVYDPQEPLPVIKEPSHLVTVCNICICMYVCVSEKGKGERREKERDVSDVSEPFLLDIPW